MTRRVSTVASPSAAGKRSSLRPLRPSRNLTDRVVGRISAEIRSGRLSPGSRLPTEQELMSAFGVSRTVVREAVSALRAEGLVLTRQGSGAFVASDTSRVPFRIDPDGLSSIEDVLSVMELRLAIEVEAAALAAERASTAQLHAIDRAVRDLDKAIGSNEGAIAEDFAFHRAIAHAAANGLFPQFLEFLGRHVIPRQSVRTARASQAEQRAYLEVIQMEHQRIADAIKAREPAEARAAMRAHLSKSLDRYRSLAERGNKRH